MLITMLIMLITFLTFFELVYIIFLKTHYFFAVFVNFFNTVLKLFFIYNIILKNAKNMTVKNSFLSFFVLTLFINMQLLKWHQNKKYNSRKVDSLWHRLQKKQLLQMF